MIARYFIHETKRNFDVMKIQSIMLLTFLILNGQNANAGETSQARPNKDQNLSNTTQKSPGRFNQFTPEFLYSYIDFNFDSTTIANYNRFQGHSNLYSVGGEHIKLFQSLYAGIYVLRVNTDLNSQALLIPGLVTHSSQSIRNNTLLGHIRKTISPGFDVDLGAGYGQNKLSGLTYIFPTTVNEILGYSNYHSNNWFANINALYRKTWNKTVLKAYAGLLYSRINADSYDFLFNSGNRFKTIAPLTNKVTYVMEGVELSHKITPVLAPFVNGGLIQVAQFSNSRPTLLTPINGSLPQLNMNRDGYKVGGGLTFNNKQFTIRLEQKYYNAGNTFTSNQTLVAVEYKFS